MARGTNSGPVLTDQEGELDVPILSCTGCKNLGVHDFHYYYCAGQPAQNQDPNNDVPYPWRGAGVQLRRGPYPTPECPYRLSNNAAVQVAIRARVGYIESEHKEELMKGALMAASFLEEHHNQLIQNLKHENLALTQMYGEVKHDMETVISIFAKHTPQ